MSDPEHTSPKPRSGPAPQGLLLPQEDTDVEQPRNRRLAIRHTTRYDYDAPVDYGVQQIRLTPKSTGGQKVLHWRTTVQGGREELSFDDAHRNRVNLLSTTPGTTHVEVVCEGEVEVEDRNGIVGQHAGFVPLWLFRRSTPATKAGPLTKALVQRVTQAGLLSQSQSQTGGGGQSQSQSQGQSQTGSPQGGTLDRLYALSAAIREAVPYETGVSEIDWTAEMALEAGRGVCQDHSHIFIAAARLMEVPARYVSGYLMMDDRIEQEATHAWVEAWIEGLGWTGFDISNAIAPDTRYVRVATGLDYSDAAPVSGTRYGTANATMTVAIQVQQ